MREGESTSPRTSAKLNRALFRAFNSLTRPTVYTSHHFASRHKESWIRTSFFECCLPKISKLVRTCRSYSSPNLTRFIETVDRVSQGTVACHVVTCHWGRLALREHGKEPQLSPKCSPNSMTRQPNKIRFYWTLYLHGRTVLTQLYRKTAASSTLTRCTLSIAPRPSCHSNAAVASSARVFDSSNDAYYNSLYYNEHWIIYSYCCYSYNAKMNTMITGMALGDTHPLSGKVRPPGR